MASILKIDVLQERYANTGILLSGQINGPLGEIITREGRLKLPNEFAANSLNIANAFAANTITANLYSGITLNMIENVAATANANQVLTADGTGNFFFADAATELKELTDVNSTATANQVLTADGTGSFYFADTATELKELTDVNSTATANQVLTADGTGSFYFADTATELKELTDVNSTATANQVLTADGTGSFFFAAASDPITVQKTNTTNAILSTVTNVNDFRFDEDSGFDIVDLGSGAVKIQMNSTFKTWKVDGQDELVATGLDTIELVAGDGITLTTNANGSPYKTITFTGANTLTDLNIVDGTANQVLTADGSGNFFFANNAAAEITTLTDIGIADGEADQVLTTDGNGSFFFGHTLSVLNQDLISGGEITQLRDCRTVIDLGTVDTRLGYAAPEGSKTVLLANDSTIVSSSSVSVISEENSIVKLNNIHLLSDVNFDAIANNSISGNKIYGGLLSTDTANIGNNALVVDSSGNVGIGISPSTKLEVSGIASLGVNENDYINARGGNGTARLEAVGTNSNVNLSLATKGSGSFYFWSDGYGGTERMRIDSDGHVTMPYQPSFIGNHSDNYNTTITSGTKITFLSATVLNRGNCWDNANQRFVCPVAGVYHIFGVDVCPGSGINNVGSLVIRLNGNEKIRGYSEERLKRVAVDLNCNVGDYIEFYTSDGALQLYGGIYGQYSIKLIG